MGKSKREKHESETGEEVASKKIKLDPDALEEKVPLDDSAMICSLGYEEKQSFCSVIAKPMAGKKLAKRLFKLIKKASKKKNFLRLGLKDVQMRIRKGETGLVIFAGDVTPIEVMCHLPGVCEEKNLPYCYVPLRHDISTAAGIKRPALMAMVRHDDDYGELYKECETELRALPLPIFN